MCILTFLIWTWNKFEFMCENLIAKVIFKIRFAQSNTMLLMSSLTTLVIYSISEIGSVSMFISMCGSNIYIENKTEQLVSGIGISCHGSWFYLYWSVSFPAIGFSKCAVCIVPKRKLNRNTGKRKNCPGQKTITITEHENKTKRNNGRVRVQGKIRENDCNRLGELMQFQSYVCKHSKMNFYQSIWIKGREKTTPIERIYNLLKT